MARSATITSTASPAEVEGLPPALSAENVAGHVWLGVVGTALAYALWFRGIESLPVQQVSLLGLCSPLVATTVGWLVLGQSLTSGQVVGAALVLLALRIGQGRMRTGSRSRRLPVAGVPLPTATR